MASIIHKGAFEGLDMVMIEYKGQRVWIAREVGKALYGDDGTILASNITSRWIDYFNEGDEKITLKGKEFNDFKKLLFDICGLRTSNKARWLLLLTESGLNQALICCSTPQARRFQKWLTHDVIPSINQTGMYIAPGAVPEALKEFIARAVKEGVDDALAKLQPLTFRRIADTSHTIGMTGDDRRLREHVLKHVKFVVGATGLHKSAVRNLSREYWRRLKDTYSMRGYSYRNLPSSMLPQALSLFEEVLSGYEVHYAVKVKREPFSLTDATPSPGRRLKVIPASNSMRGRRNLTS